MDQPVSPIRRHGVRTILAVGADRVRLSAIAQRLGSLGHMVVLADSAAQALELIAARGFDLVLVDALPEGAALYLIRQVTGARETADLPVMMIAEDEDGLIAALGSGADDAVTPPYAFATLAARIDRLLAHAARIEELKRTNLALDARIAARAIELGEARDALAALRG